MLQYLSINNYALIDTIEINFSKGFSVITGETGSGKSHLIATAKRPLILLTEANGFASIAASNPDALVIPCYNLNDFDEALKAVKNGEIKNFDTLIIDSLTEFQRMIKERIQKQTKKSYLFIPKEASTTHFLFLS